MRWWTRLAIWWRRRQGVRGWLTTWRRTGWRDWTADALLQDYHAAFHTGPGQRVLGHMLDTVYCQVVLSRDPMELAFHNGRRSVLQEILENLQHAETHGRQHAGQETPTYAGPDSR